MVLQGTSRTIATPRLSYTTFAALVLSPSAAVPKAQARTVAVQAQQTYKEGWVYFKPLMQASNRCPCCTARAWVDGVHALLLGHRQDALNVQVAGHGALAHAHLIALVCLVAVRLQPVSWAVDGQLRPVRQASASTHYHCLHAMSLADHGPACQAACDSALPAPALFKSRTASAPLITIRPLLWSPWQAARQRACDSSFQTWLKAGAHRAQAQLSARTEHADGYLAAVGAQDLFKRRLRTAASLPVSRFGYDS